MTRLTRLPDIADRALGGLNADARLLGRIKLAAARRAGKPHFRWQPALAGMAAVAFCLGMGLWVAPLFNVMEVPGTQLSSEVMGSRAAGGTQVQDGDVFALALGGAAGTVSGGDAQAGAGSYRNLFAPERKGNFPLILVDGAAYRMLISPTNMKDSLLGDALGEVTEYTLEPALSEGDGVVSNVVSAGETVYAVQGMRGAMAAARVQGSLRVFQRVSFAGTAILGRETLADTLASADAVVAMELTGAGIVDDPAKARALMQTLLSDAEYESASASTGDERSLLIALQNGLLVQLMVGEDTLSACGTWSCPAFFEAYPQAAAQ